MSPSSTKNGSASIDVDLHRHVRWASTAPNSDTGTRRVEQQRAARARAGLGELLRRQHAQREAGVDDVVREAVDRADDRAR